MTDERDHEAIARAIIDTNLYMVLGTADAAGRPWAAPVYFAHADYRAFFWVSSPEATHSVNLRTRPELAVVIFDSTVPIATGQAVYMSAVARELAADEWADELEIYSSRAVAHGGRAFTPEDVRSPARLRLFRADADAQYVLDEHDERVPVTL